MSASCAVVWRRAGLALAVVAGLMLSGCANKAEQRRQELRNEALGTGLLAVPRDESVRRNMAILAGDAPESGVDTMRWQAAQNLGNLGAKEAFSLLLSNAIGPARDLNPTVRRECVIALGKLPYESGRDVRRTQFVAAFDAVLRASAGAPAGTTASATVERDPRVRIAMVDALVSVGLAPGSLAKGGRDATRHGRRDIALTLLQLAETLHRVGVRDAVQGPENQGLVDLALDGVRLIAGIPYDEAVVIRARGLDALAAEERPPGYLVPLEAYMLWLRNRVVRLEDTTAA